MLIRCWNVCGHVKVFLFCRQRLKLLSLTSAGKCPPFCITPRGTTIPNTTYAVSFRTLNLVIFTNVINVICTLTPLPSASVKNPIDASVLLTEASLARKQRKSHATFIPLMVTEMPQAGDLVGLDAEFVTLNQVSQDHNAAVCSPYMVNRSLHSYVFIWSKTPWLIGVITVLM